ncbi:DUF6037 family protein [Cellulophaga sp. L1A9]|uniref:DUF6037 family protein n=1 Tax=Cellulophaga sp. L1A9 TaxID=2686362 RepID=UPI00131D53EB|nr:DUF6037 family protein [Cellulophaga sp. L1A9]
MNIFENFKLLKSDMIQNGWVIEAFPFNYKMVDYIILAKLYQEHEKRPKYALLKTEIIKADNTSKSLTIPANSNGFITDAKTLREFFNIEYSKNIGDILKQFENHFSIFIPTQINPNKPGNLKKSMISSLSKSDSEDPEKIYCFTVRRNPNKESRSLFNDNKSRLLRPNLYLKFKEEPTISFCYSKNIIDEKSDEEVLLNFSKRT